MQTVTPDRPGQAVTISSQALEDFESLFVEWMFQGENRIALEAGGTGRLEDLARMASAWALKEQQLSGQDRSSSLLPPSSP